MKLYYRPKELLQQLRPADIGMQYTSVQRMELNGKITIESGAEELCLVCIAGAADYACGKASGRAMLLDMLYVPIGTTLTLDGQDGVFMKYGAPCGRKTRFAHIRFADVDKDGRHKVYGKQELGTKRDVWNYIDESFDSSRFLVGVCKGANGGWTAWPPHEHAKPREEVYVYFNMGDSFAAQFVYDDMDHPYTVQIVREGDFVSIPRGYHPNVGCPCGGIFYVYVMVSTTAEDRNFMDLNTQKVYGDKLE